MSLVRTAKMDRYGKAGEFALVFGGSWNKIGLGRTTTDGYEQYISEV